MLIVTQKNTYTDHQLHTNRLKANTHPRTQADLQPLVSLLSTLRRTKQPTFLPRTASHEATHSHAQGGTHSRSCRVFVHAQPPTKPPTATHKGGTCSRACRVFSPRTWLPSGVGFSCACVRRFVSARSRSPFLSRAPRRVLGHRGCWWQAFLPRTGRDS